MGRYLIYPGMNSTCLSGTEEVIIRFAEDKKLTGGTTTGCTQGQNCSLGGLQNCRWEEWANRGSMKFAKAKSCTGKADPCGNTIWG